MKTQYGFTRFDNLNEFKTWIAKQPKYNYTGLQVHHTALPDYSCFYKSNGTTEDELTRQNSMKSFHVNTNKWSNIAQHFTVFPNGKIVTGRPLSSTTAIGIKGWNSNKICVEIYGNFDKDVMTKEQKEAVICLYGELCKKFGLTPSTSTIRCHAWFTAGGSYLGDYKAGKSAKTCPGTKFMGFGNSKAAFDKNFIPLIKQYIANGTVNTGNAPKESSVVSKTIDALSSLSNKGFKKYAIRTTADSLNGRKGPGMNYDITQKLPKGTAVTIVEEAMNGETKWGKTASGYWIALAYTQFVKYV